MSFSINFQRSAQLLSTFMQINIFEIFFQKHKKNLKFILLNVSKSNKMTIKKIIFKNLQNQRKSGLLCDIRLFIGKQFTYVHSAVLCPLSMYINKAYLSSKYVKLKHKNKNLSYCSARIKLNNIVPDDCFDCLKKLIDYIYGNDLSVKPDHFDHLNNYCKSLDLCRTILNFIDKNVINQNNDKKNMSIISLCLDKLENIKMVHPEKSKDLESDLDISSDFDCDFDIQNSDQENFENYSKNLKTKHENAPLKLPSGKTQNCVDCEFKCYKSIDLLTHLIQTNHGGNMCSLCWAQVDDPIKLKDHILLHDHPKPFFCLHCFSRFQTRTLLAQHLPSHMIQRPFSCNECQKTYKSKHALNCHILTHSTEKKHLCDECGFSTLHARMLRAHKLIHNGKLFKCTFPNCHHTSTIKQNMEQHIITHNNIQKYVCELCGRKFTQCKSLKRHAMIHSQEEITNACPHCPFKARRIDNLKAHILRQHTEKNSKKFSNSESITVQPNISDILESITTKKIET